MKEFLGVGQLRLAFVVLDVQNRYVEVVNVPPGFIGRGHYIQLGVVEGPPLVQLHDRVFGRIAQTAAIAGEQGDAGGGEEGS